MKATWKTVQILILAVVCLGQVDKVNAQQDPQYSHYMFSEMNYNPAFAGNHQRRICATFLQHSQWTQFDGVDGGESPNTQVFNIHAPITNKYVQGAGLSIFNDQQGFENTISVSASASHKLNLGIGRLSLGLNVGFIQKELNGDKLRAIEGNDPLIPDGTVSNTMLDLGFGGFLTADNYYVGISGLHLNEPDIGWNSNGEGKSSFVRHFYLTGGYNYDLNQSWSIKPSVLLKYEGSKLVTDINARAVLQEKYWGGLGYRVGDNTLNGMIGMYLTPKLKVGYSFDLPFDPNDIKSGGTHEILLGYCFQLDTKAEDEHIIWPPRHL